MKKLMTVALSCALCHANAQQAPAVDWQFTYGGTLLDQGYAIVQTADGGYILCGTTYSSNGDVSGYHGNGDIWVAKLDANGAIEWQRALGGTLTDSGKGVLQLTDGSYLVMGTARSNDGDVSGQHGGGDFWLAKLDPNGALTWQHCYGGSLLDSAWDMKATVNGGWIVVGYSQSSDGDLTANAGLDDVWVLKLDSSMQIEWQRSYGGSGGDNAFAVDLAAAGGYIVAGSSTSTDGGVVGNHGFEDYYVLRLDGSGGPQWSLCLGGSDTDQAFDILQLSNGGFAVFGETGSADGDVQNFAGYTDYWIATINDSGALVWAKTFGGSSTDTGRQLVGLPDGGFLLVGYSESNDGDVGQNNGSFDGWWVRTDSTGNILWQMSKGGSLDDRLSVVDRTSDNGFIGLGGAQSSDGDVPGNQGSGDLWVVKFGLETVGITEPSGPMRIKLFPNPCADQLWLTGEQFKGAIVGWVMYDGTGRCMAKSGRTSLPTMLPVDGLAPGLYSVVVEADGARSASLFQKE